MTPTEEEAELARVIALWHKRDAKAQAYIKGHFPSGAPIIDDRSGYAWAVEERDMVCENNAALIMAHLRTAASSRNDALEEAAKAVDKYAKGPPCPAGKDGMARAMWDAMNQFQERLAPEIAARIRSLKARG